MVWVKICGIQDIKSAEEAVASGADALGFVFADSRRQVTADQVRLITTKLPESVLKIGVFVNESKEKLKKIYKDAGLTHIQLHGDETPDFAEAMELPYIKAIRVQSEESLRSVGGFTSAEFILLDTYIKGGERGGTGHSFDWSLASKSSHPKTIVAGGLDATNVKEAIKTSCAFGVDVSSGVEIDGKKNAPKMRAFVKEAKS